VTNGDVNTRQLHHSVSHHKPLHSSQWSQPASRSQLTAHSTQYRAHSLLQDPRYIFPCPTSWPRSTLAHHNWTIPNFWSLTKETGHYNNIGFYRTTTGFLSSYLTQQAVALILFLLPLSTYVSTAPSPRFISALFDSYLQRPIERECWNNVTNTPLHWFTISLFSSCWNGQDLHVLQQNWTIIT
jgi:hypothetical protein